MILTLVYFDEFLARYCQCKCQIASGNTRNMLDLKLIDQRAYCPITAKNGLHEWHEQVELTKIVFSDKKKRFPMISVFALKTIISN